MLPSHIFTSPQSFTRHAIRLSHSPPPPFPLHLFIYASYRFQKAIKKVRATQRMRRQRGFAFSQTEGGGSQDQEKLIRSYDTSVQRPSGY